MTTLSIIFIVLAILNILLAVDKWAKTEKEYISEIAGWACAIIWCISSSL